MPRCPRVLLLLSLLVAPPDIAAQTGAECGGPPEVCGFFETFVAALNRRDWAAFRATFADDITVIFERPGPPQRQDGREAVEAVFRNIFPQPGSAPGPLPPPLVPEGILVQSYGDVAIVSFHLPRQGQMARRTLVLHRTPRAWEVIHIHGSVTDLPSQ